MRLSSENITIKSVSKWRYRVSLLQDKRGIYHVVSENLITSKMTAASLIDYGMADHAFESKINSFEGN